MTNNDNKRIAGLSVVINGTAYHYEAHSYLRVAEILASQLEVIKTIEKNEYGQPIYNSDFQSFTINYFAD